MSHAAHPPALALRSPFTKSLAALLATAIALPTHVALAMDPRSPDARPLVVVDLSADVKEVAEILLDVRLTVAEHTNAKFERDYIVQDTNASLNAGGETRDRQNVATAQGLVQAGKASFEAKDYRDAADQYESAKKLFEESLAVFDDPTTAYPPVLLRLGESYTLSGEKQSALGVFAEAAIWGAAGDSLGPTARALFDKAQADVGARAHGTSDITTVPPFAEVFVDGQFKGISPVSVGDLIVGPHLVTATKPGYERVTTRLDIAKDKSVKREIKLPIARRKLLLDELKPKLEAELAAAETKGGPKEGKGGDAIAQLGTLFRAETVLLMRADGPPAKKRLALYLFHVPTQRMVGHQVIEGIDASQRNTEGVKAATTTTFDVDWVTALGGQENKAGDTASGGGSIVGKWWFWTIIGVVVAGGTTAAVLATQSSASPPPFAKTSGTGAMVLRF